MLPCKGCAYRESIPGDAHIRCVFDWFPPERLDAFVRLHADVPARAAQWFRFPFNYDPVWGPNECASRAETRDPANVAKPNLLADLLSLLR